MSTPGARMGLFGRIRSSLRRSCVRYGQDPRKKPGRTFGVRSGRRGYIRLKLAIAIAVVVGIGLGILIVAARSHREDRDMDEFIKEFQGMYDEEEKSDDGGGIALRADGDQGSTVRYDPKARAFIDPKMRQKWGMEAEKGREKRRLFTEVHAMSQERGRPQLTLKQLMKMPSSFDASRGVSDTTIILNQWKRTTLSEQLNAILAQTVRPAGGVWVCLFDSPREHEYRRVVEQYGDRFKDSGGLFFISSTFNFKYYGRFQMALQARTKYVWIVDDDVMPGNKFLEQLSYIAGIPEAEGSDGSVGPMALGSVGWIMPGVKPSNGEFYSYRYHTDRGGLFLPDKRYGIPVPNLQEVDLLCSHWFLQTDWVRLLFREKWETPETGEDYMLAYSLRKYAGVRSFVLPMDLHDSQTWGNTDVDWSLQHQGAGGTTLRSTVPTRNRIWHRLFKRGGEYFMSPRYAPRPRPIILVIDGQTDAEALRPLFLELQASYPPMTGRSSTAHAIDYTGAPLLTPQRPPRVVLTARGGGSISCTRAASILGNPISKQERRATLCLPDNFSSAWELMAGRHFPRQGTGRSGGSGGRDHELMADLARGLSGAVDALEPLAIVSVAGSGPSAGIGEEGGGGAAIDEALGLVTGQSGVPLIRLPRRADASGAALWLSRLTPRAFAAWHRARVDILVVYEPSSDASGDGGGGGGGGSRGSSGSRGHTEAQLQALLDSLSAADYLGDKVGITVAVGSGAVPDLVGRDFSWPRGSKVIRGPIHAPPPPPFTTEDGDSAGISGEGGKGGGVGGKGRGEGAMGALALRSWIPRDDHNFVVVLEADRVVSRLFYSWLKVAMLETTYGGGQLASSSLPTRGVCVPGTGGAEGGGGSGGGGGSSGSSSGGHAGDIAWLLPAGHWRSAQARCLTDHAEGKGGGGGGSCEVDGYPGAPERSLCPSLEPGKALIARTGPDGLVLGGLKTMMGDDKALAHLVKRAIFPQQGVSGR